MTINRYGTLWYHTKKRVDDAENKAKNANGELDLGKFAQIMITRLNRITHEEKIYYAISYLKEKGYNDIVDIYEGRLFMDEFVKRCR